MNLDHDRILSMLEAGKRAPLEETDAALCKAERFEGLAPEEIAMLLQTEDEGHIKRIFDIAGRIKEHIYGDRIVMFAPLYVSDHCVNKCAYCGYRCDNVFDRRRLSMDEIREEVRILEGMGHKRLALEAGEDPKKCPIDYILEVIDTIYGMHFENGEIRRVNVNIASTTVENYRRLKDAGIGTYILFQETYHRETYKEVHMAGPKSNYDYHITAFDRAMEAGIDDVGGGVLFGLYDYKYEVLGLMLHNEHLEKKFGAGFHTISVPRIRPADGADITVARHIPTDEQFQRLVAIIRLAVPFTGMIVSTRETADMRAKLIRLGVSQISGGSAVEVGGYAERERHGSGQFEVSDNRAPEDIVKWLMSEDLIPSFCTACYRQGRTGDRFMQLAKSGNIKNVCLPNALMTLCEYAQDYGDEETLAKASEIILRKLPDIQNEKIRKRVEESIERIRGGKRDLYL